MSTPLTAAQASAIRERPILFSAPMVQAILAGRKTVTRRVVKERQFPAPFHQRCSAVGVAVALREMYEQGRFEERPFPYGQPGDRLWVRETWAKVPHPPAISDRCKVGPEGWGATWRADWTGNPSGYTWKPSIHMPRWASRLTLEVTGVRVERLHDITEEDAKAEGVEAKRGAGAAGIQAGPVHLSHVVGFRELWCDINGPESWDANPWVWAVSFRRVP